MKTVAIIGASGYVGSRLLVTLAPLFKVTAINRGADSISRKVPGVEYCTTPKSKETYDIVINTAYSSANNDNVFLHDNLQILKLIQQLSANHTHIIHLSTLAVFGFGLDIPIQPIALPDRTDYPYVTSKLQMENLLLHHFSHSRLSIIRLGNVWGPANQSWTQPIADAIVWGMPVLNVHTSFSNLTFIHNITSYVHYVMESETQQTFHHLAEHNQITWQQVIGEIGAQLQLKPQLIETLPFYPVSIGEEVNHAIMLDPVGMLRALKSGRFTSSKFPRSILSMLLSLKSKLYKRSTNRTLPPYETDPVFHWVLSTNKPFTNHVLDGWLPPFSWEQTSKLTLDWLQEAGY
jgi:nucleoside-diphosphate-sugar epimerase